MSKMFSFLSADNREYVVDFVHLPESDPNKLYSHRTICVITTPERGENDNYGFGVAFCSKKDHFDRKIGRKNALARALQSTFPKSDPFWKDSRFHAWQSYFGKQHQLLLDLSSM